MKGIRGVLAQRNLREVQGIVEKALIEYVDERSEDPAMKYAKDILLAGGKRFRPVSVSYTHLTLPTKASV